MNELFLIPICGLFDRIRGGLWKDKIPFPSALKSILYGFIFSLLVLDPQPLSLTFAILFAIGESFGWGTILANALGENRTSWDGIQKGILRKTVWGSVVARGAVWGFFPSLLGFIDPKLFLVFPAMILGFTLSPLLFRLKHKWRLASYEWGNMEILRGILMASFVLLFQEYLWFPI